MKRLSFLLMTVAATPAVAAGDTFVSLTNTDFVVLLAFILFVGFLIYMKVPGMLGKLLDKRADAIQGELNEAKALREEAQTVLASYERKQREVKEHSDRIVAAAHEEAKLAAEQAKKDLEVTVARRLASAKDQIASAQAKVIKEVRDEAVQVAIAAARDVIAKQMTAASGNALIDDAITVVDAKLH